MSEEHVKLLPGEHWLPHKNKTGALRRIPCPATLNALIDRYRLFVNRLLIDQHSQQANSPENGCLSDLPPLDESVFGIVGYRRANGPGSTPLRRVQPFENRRQRIS